MMGSKWLKPEDGKTYKNRNGEEYVCVRTDGGESVMVRFGDADGDAWMVKVMFCRIYDDKAIDWQSSRCGAFLSADETREIRKEIECRRAERRAREFEKAAQDFKKAAQDFRKAVRECKEAAHRGALRSAAETLMIRKEVEYMRVERRAREFEKAAQDFKKAAQDFRKAAQECKKTAEEFKKAAQKIEKVTPDAGEAAGKPRGNKAARGKAAGK